MVLRTAVGVYANLAISRKLCQVIGRTYTIGSHSSKVLNPSNPNQLHLASNDGLSKFLYEEVNEELGLLVPQVVQLHFGVEVGQAVFVFPGDFEFPVAAFSPFLDN